MLAFLGVALVFLILLSAFFSGAETAMMSINRYKLRHLARKKNIRAKRVQQLLGRTDRLLSVVLLGNTFANIFASAITTVLAQRWFGDLGVFIVTMALTVFILLFSEIIPKTYAALYPEKIAYPVSLPLVIFLKILYPLAWGLNISASLIFKFFGVVVGKRQQENLTREELRAVVIEGAIGMNTRHQNMLLGVLDLEHAVLLDVMVPRHQITGIDLNLSGEKIFQRIKHTPHSKLPVYRDHLDNLMGILPVKRLVGLLEEKWDGNYARLPEIILEKQLLDKPYFVPETTTLQKQLLEFEKNREHFGLVVDEYGDIQGMITLEDIVEEIVGSISGGPQRKIIQESDGSYLLVGGLSLREINRSLGIHLPLNEAKTLSGLITDHLQSIPTPKTCVKVEGYVLEIMEVEDNAVKIAKLGKILV